MTCSHTKGVQFYQMYWFQQRPGLAVRPMVYTLQGNKRQDYSPGFTEEKFPAAKPDVHSGSLTVRDLVPRDSGLYFCAVSQHSGTSLLHC
ncbi:unnamed protein product [Lota lota]